MNCKRCSVVFNPVRVAQVYCSPRCRDAAAKQRKRSQRSMDAETVPTVVLRSMDIASQRPLQASDEPLAPYVNPHGPTPGALQGDDYQLEYYEDGYPKLPASLDRRPIKLAEAA